MAESSMESTLTLSQTKALEIARKKSRMHQNALTMQINDLLHDNGIDESFLKVFDEYIKNVCPIVCHGKFTLKSLLEQPFIKNAHELKAHDLSYIKYRDTKESTIFNKSYDSAKPDEKPKYASLNITNNPKCNPLCVNYGRNIIFFKNEIKNRTTFVYGNSESSMFYVCTFTYPLALLFHIGKEIGNLKTLIETNTSNGLSMYIECQLHGTVDINLDVEKIVIDRNDADNTKYMDKFTHIYPHIKIEYY